MAFLNETGLATFLSYLKAWARATFASKTDTQTIEGATTFSQTVVASISGNAGTATKLAVAKTINGVVFDGSANITVADSTKVSKTGNETISGVKTFSGRIELTRTQDASGTADNKPALMIGSMSGTHLELDGNELMCKASATTTGSLFINSDGGNVYIGGTSSGNRAVTGAGKGSTSLPVYTDENGIATACGTSLGVSITGNAATATAFSSSKTVELTGAVTGTVSSTGGWSVDTKWRSCIVGLAASSTNNPWYKVATCSIASNLTNYDVFITFLVENTYYREYFGILRAHVRIGSDKKVTIGSTDFRWLVNNGFTLEDFVLVCPTTASPTIEIWTRITSGWTYRRFIVLSEGIRSDTAIKWTLLNASSSTGQEASIPTAGTQITSAAGEFVGNSSTATKLANAITINDVSFDGSANITVADSTKVSKTGNESIGGVKTFTDNPVISNATPILTLKNTDNASYGDIRFANSSGSAKAAIRENMDTGQLTIGNAYNKGSWDSGAWLLLNNSGNFTLRAKDGTNSTALSGTTSGTLTWGGQAIQTSSDERLKTSLSPVPDDVLDAWEAVGWGQFQYLDALERKGENARLHLGLIAQRVKAVFEELNLDACQYGILCYEEEEDLWTVRYAEALAMEAACQRRRADRLEARIAALEEAVR